MVPEERNGEVTENEATTTTAMEKQGDTPDGEGSGEGGGDTFPRAYVDKLRRENQSIRAKAKDRDELERSLFKARVKLDGRLADPDTLEWKEEYSDPEVLENAITGMIERNPRLSARAVGGSIGQGEHGRAAPSLIDVMRGLI